MKKLITFKCKIVIIMKNLKYNLKIIFNRNNKEIFLNI